MNRDDVRRALRSFVLTSFLAGEAPSTLQDSTRLLSSGIVTSLSLLELVTFIEETFRVTLEADDVGVARMDSIDMMVTLVDERSGKDPGGARTGA